MQRVKRATAVAVLPADPGGGTPGYFPVPNPGGGVPAAVPGYEWFNNVQEELLAVIEGQSIVASGSDRTQLRQAIAKMIQAGQRAVVFDSVTFNAGVANGNAVYWDSANTRFDKALADGSAKQNAAGFADVTNSRVYAFGDAVLFSGLTPGKYYLDGTTAGAITATAPATNVVFMGIAKSATEVFVDIDAAAGATTSSVQGAFKNLQASATGTNATVTVSADEIVVESAANAYQTLRTVALAINSAAGGANGLDTGALAINTWYSVWVIWNGTTTAGLISLSATAPTMPGGYTHKTRVGWVRTDSSGNKYPLAFNQAGRQVTYTPTTGTNLTALPVMASGVAGTVQATLVAVAVGAYVPTTAGSIAVSLHQTSGAASQVGPVNIPGSTAGGGLYLTNNSGGGNIHGKFVLSGSNIYWASSGAQSLCAMGWEDNL